MKAPGIIDGVIVAIIISIYAAVVGLVLGSVTGFETLFSMILCGSSLIYLIYLLKRSREKPGRVVVMASWALLSIGSWFLDIPLFSQVLVQAGLVWLVRTLYFHGSLLSATLDGGLVAVGLATSAWAMINTGSLAGALWSFFLVQSLFCWIPNLNHQRSGRTAEYANNQSPFQSAHRVAHDAVRKLTQA